jgi:hypothetical protein
MPDDMIMRYSTLVRAPYGMVICAGPTGSGKTTTLYGTVGEINSPERNVMTIEDPVEYRIPSTNQIQINDQAGITFAGGLRSILRQDPDIILVGEIRDVDTARIAVQAALTGHFVLSSLHATDAPAALHRLLDMGIEGFLVASSVTGVVSQRLVRRICDQCRETYQPSHEELALLQAIRGMQPAGGFVRGKGCNFCAQRLPRPDRRLRADADHGRIRDLVFVSAPSHDEIRKVARAEGMRTLQDEAARPGPGRGHHAVRGTALYLCGWELRMTMTEVRTPGDEESPEDGDHAGPGEARGDQASPPASSAHSCTRPLPILDAVRILGEEAKSSTLRKVSSRSRKACVAVSGWPTASTVTPGSSPTSTAASCVRPS